MTGASVDLAMLRKLAASREGDGSGLVARVVNTYVFTSRKILSAVRKAVEAGDLKAFVSAAHNFKSSSAHLGALRLSSLCEDLESLGRGGSCDGARDLVDRISEEFESVQRQLAAADLSSRAPSDAIDPKGAAFPSRAEATVKAGVQGEVLAHVLVVEDDEVNQLVVVAILESMGCRVDAVDNGQEAIDQLERSSSYDLVFMDCEMPTMDALEATRIIRAREAKAAQTAGGAPVRRIHIVALTAHDLDLDRQQCLAAGMDDYLTKPFTKADLQGAIDRAKQGADAGGPAPAKSKRPDPPAAASKREKRSKSTGARPAAPKSRASAGSPPGRGAERRRTRRRMPKGPDGLPLVHRERGGAPAAPPPRPTESAVSIGQVALQQMLVPSRDVNLEERSRAEPRWRRLIRDASGVMPWAIGRVKRWAIGGVVPWAVGVVKRWASSGVKPWAIGGGMSLVVLVLVNLLWLGSAEPDPEPRLAAPSPGTSADGPVPAPRTPVSKPAAMADRGASTAAPAEPDATTATAPALTASRPHTATPAPAPEVVPEPAAKPATVVQPRRATTPRTAARRATTPPTRARATDTPKTKSATSPRSRGRTNAVSKQTKPRTTSGSRTVEKEPSTRSRSSQKEAQDGWTIEH